MAGSSFSAEKLGLEQTWRWYGPNDPVTLADIKMAGATGIVTALHEVETGSVWEEKDINELKNIIEAAGLTWSVVESIPVPEAVKYGGDERDALIENYKTSIRNVAACGIDVVCYNFMPVVDWTRTNLDFDWGDGSKALRFDRKHFAAFDLFVLKRPGAESEYTDAQVRLAKECFDGLSQEEKDAITRNIVMGLPGRMVEAYSMEEFQRALDQYKGLTEKDVTENLRYFLERIIPVCEEVGVFMAIHPDDPPCSLLGLPRVVSTTAQLRTIVNMKPSISNGLTVCVGSMASRPDNDIKALVEEFASKIHFIHLRNVKKDEDQETFFCSFTEADHLTGDIDMFHVIKTMLSEQKRRLLGGLPSSRLPFRPDHGHQMCDDLYKKTNPGYTNIGRLRGLGELRGLQMGILKSKLV